MVAADNSGDDAVLGGEGDDALYGDGVPEDVMAELAASFPVLDA